MYNYTRLIWAMHNLYKSALALRVLFYFLRSLYIYSSPYLTRDTYYRLIKYITFGVLLCVTHSDHLAILTRIICHSSQGLLSCLYYINYKLKLILIPLNLNKQNCQSLNLFNYYNKACQKQGNLFIVDCSSLKETICAN